MNGCVNSRPWPAWAEAFVAALFATGPALGAPSASVFRIDGHRPVGAVISIGDSWDPSLPLATPMGRLAAGVLDAYDRRSIGKLLRCATRQVLPPDARGRRVAVIQLLGREGAEDPRLEVVHLTDGSWGARAIEQETGDGVLLDQELFEAIVSRWPMYRGGFETPSEPDSTGRSMTLDPPYVAGSVTLDPEVQKHRLYRGMPIRRVAPDRVLDSETMHVRVPAGYDPRRPAGLVVWSSPTPRGAIPREFGPALDELNMLCIGSDNTGNDRDVPDKFQMVFDAVATARARYHIDDRRIYITGMSGGGKVSSILAVCFADVFAGAVPIVGFGCYSSLDDSWGQHRNPYYAKPRGRLLQLARAHRMALMGGPPDFNYREMSERAARLEADGFTNIRFFSYPDMAHVMPTASRFADALRWIDEPRRRVRLEETARAATLLTAYHDTRDDAAPRTRADRDALAEVIEAGPWTDAAWSALELLRLTTHR